jgi:hypothetical protein
MYICTYVRLYHAAYVKCACGNITSLLRASVLLYACIYIDVRLYDVQVCTYYCVMRVRMYPKNGNVALMWMCIVLRMAAYEFF